MSANDDLPISNWQGWTSAELHRWLDELAKLSAEEQRKTLFNALGNLLNQVEVQRSHAEHWRRYCAQWRGIYLNTAEARARGACRNVAESATLGDALGGIAQQIAARNKDET